MSISWTARAAAGFPLARRDRVNGAITSAASPSRSAVRSVGSTSSVPMSAKDTDHSSDARKRRAKAAGAGQSIL